MKHIGNFKSKKWGDVRVMTASYGASGPLAVVLQCDNGEPLATLSVNMYRPECSHDSADLPADCFYVNRWSENEQLSAEALESGLFIERHDLPVAESGFVDAPAWQLKGDAA